jgi:hypothetical protein
VRASDRLSRAGAWLTLAAVAVGAALLGAAMRAYPGGTAGAPARPGHSFWANYLCDLTGEVAVNGSSNARGAALARGGMLALSTALGLAFLIMPRVLRGGRAQAAVVRGGGVLCALGLIAVPAANGALHAPLVLGTVVPGVAAMGTTLVGLASARRRGLLGLAVGALGASVLDAVLYAGKIAGAVAAASTVVPAVQRIAAVLLVTWMAAVAAAVLRAED